MNLTTLEMTENELINLEKAKNELDEASAD